MRLRPVIKESNRKVLKSLFPSRQQRKGWTIPSRHTALGLLISIVGLTAQRFGVGDSGVGVHRHRPRSEHGHKSAHANTTSLSRACCGLGKSLLCPHRPPPCGSAAAVVSFRSPTVRPLRGSPTGSVVLGKSTPQPSRNWGLKPCQRTGPPDFWLRCRSHCPRASGGAQQFAVGRVRGRAPLFPSPQNPPSGPKPRLFCGHTPSAESRVSVFAAERSKPRPNPKIEIRRKSDTRNFASWRQFGAGAAVKVASFGGANQASKPGDATGTRLGRFSNFGFRVADFESPLPIKSWLATGAAATSAARSTAEAAG
jgi:hypothetical protein